MAFDWTTFWFVIIIGLLVLGFVMTLLWFLSLRRKRKEMPSHLQLYFDDNFRKIMDEWDITTRDRVKEFKKDMGKRLKKVGKDIDTLENKKNHLEKRLSGLEAGMEKMEEF